MIKDVDDALLEALKKGLSDVVPPGNIITGLLEKPAEPSLRLACIDFDVEEQGIGGSRIVKKEEVVETFDSGGQEKEFTLSSPPVKPLLSVEAPAGTQKNEPADYTADYVKGIVSFREAPEKGKKGVLVRYNVAKASGEVILLKLRMDYSLVITSKDIDARNDIALRAIDALYRERGALAKSGVEDIRLKRGYSLQAADGKPLNSNVLEWEAVTTYRIALPPSVPMGKIELGEIKRG